MNQFRAKVRVYWPLIKSLQTGLLITTGLAGYMSARCPVLNPGTMLGLLASLFLSISGSTVLNMWWDRDIDARMARTRNRPLARGAISPNEGLSLGLILSTLGVGIAVAMNWLYGMIIFAGLFFDVVVYSIWLKRRTAWGIIWGGVSGGMPILAGRVLGYGGFDWVGFTLAAGVLFWIPTHIMTFSIKYMSDYQAAGVPTFPSIYGLTFTRKTIAVSSVLATLAILSAAIGIGMAWGFLRLLSTLGGGLLLIALVGTLYPSERVNYSLFKYASFYMLGSMLIIVLEAL